MAIIQKFATLINWTPAIIKIILMDSANHYFIHGNTPEV